MTNFFKKWLIKMPKKENDALMQRAEVISSDEPSQEQLEQWFQSSDYTKRGCAAWNRYKLEILINDPHPYVRSCVADSFYGLDKLASDPNKCVTEEVQRMLNLAKLTLEEWVERNPERCALPENRAKAPCNCSRCKMKFKIAGARFCPYCGASTEEEKEQEYDQEDFFELFKKTESIADVIQLVSVFVKKYETRVDDFWRISETALLTALCIRIFEIEGKERCKEMLERFWVDLEQSDREKRNARLDGYFAGLRVYRTLISYNAYDESVKAYNIFLQAAPTTQISIIKGCKCLFISARVSNCYTYV